MRDQELAQSPYLSLTVNEDDNNSTPNAPGGFEDSKYIKCLAFVGTITSVSYSHK